MAVYLRRLSQNVQNFKHGDTDFPDFSLNKDSKEENGIDMAGLISALNQVNHAVVTKLQSYENIKTDLEDL